MKYVSRYNKLRKSYLTLLNTQLFETSQSETSEYFTQDQKQVAIAMYRNTCYSDVTTISDFNTKNK